ncbi:MAG: hypothetical protein R3B38_03025 [Patescibacteria group bacterium]
MLATPVWATSLSMTGGSAVVNQTSIANIYINTQGKEINAIDGRLTLSGNGRIEDMRIGGSVVGIWVQQGVSTNGKTLEFAGAIPGGFTGSGLLFSVEYRAQGTGLLSFGLEGVRTLLNDGLGTKDSVTVSGVTVRVSPATAPTDETQPEKADTTKPESFTVKLIQDESVFDGKWHIVFNATDGQSGVDHYEIKEGNGDWIIGESPYLLQDQELKGPILVRAVDEFANYREARVNPPFSAQNPMWYWIVGLIALIAIIYEGWHIFVLETQIQKQGIKK